MNWQPIAEFNRKELQFVLVTDCDVVRLRLWCPFQNRWEPEPPRMGALTDMDDCHEPTHWMPIPELPQTLALSQTLDLRRDREENGGEMM